MYRGEETKGIVEENLESLEQQLKQKDHLIFKLEKELASKNNSSNDLAELEADLKDAEEEIEKLNYEKKSRQKQIELLENRLEDNENHLKDLLYERKVEKEKNDQKGKKDLQDLKVRQNDLKEQNVNFPLKKDQTIRRF